MSAAGSGRWVRAVLITGAVYLLVSVVFGVLAGGAATDTMRVLWRRAAWLTAGVVFVAHVRFERSRLGNAPVATAFHAALGAALGACGLAVAALVNALTSGTGDLCLLAIALVAFPGLTVVPAFLVALAVVAVLPRKRAGAAA